MATNRSHTIIPATAMPEQCSNIEKEAARRDARVRAMETNASGSRNPETPLVDADAINIVSQILPDWEIDATTNLPLHMHCCHDCLLFMEHVKQNLQGGALSIYLECQKKHWRHMLCNKMRDELSKAYKDGLREGEHNIEMLEDKLDCFHRQVQSLEAENANLRRRIAELSHSDNGLRGRGHIAGGLIRREEL